MSKTLLLLFLLSSCKSKKIVTHYIQLLEPENWPTTLYSNFEIATNELTNYNKCWWLEYGSKVIKTKCNKPTNIRFAKYQSVEDLKPWKRETEKIKAVYFYDSKNKNGKIRIKQYVWDGEKYAVFITLDQTFMANLQNTFYLVGL